MRGRAYGNQVSRMTLDEKVTQMNTFAIAIRRLAGACRVSAPNGMAPSLRVRASADMEWQARSGESSVPSYQWWSEGLHGVMFLNMTSFPQSTPVTPLSIALQTHPTSSLTLHPAAARCNPTQSLA